MVEVRLSGVVVCQDEAARIGACLDSLAFCDEVVVIDSGSSDATVDIARAHGARVIEHAWAGMNAQKDFGRTQARGRWILNLDADEVASEELAVEARRIADDDVDRGPSAYLVPFRNYFRDAWVRRCGYYPDPHVRFMRSDRTRWDASVPVHDKVLVDGDLGRLRGHVDHYSFESLDDFLEKSRRYSKTFARAAYAGGRRASAGTILFHTGWRFFKAYVLRAGFLEGALGLTVSGLQAYEVFQKYARLWELTRFEGASGGGGRDEL